MNPKDLVGSKKAPLGLVPPALEIGASEAMENGAVKYGPFNWREKPIEYMSYLVAMKRHLDALIDGQDNAEDTGIHHLKHIAAGAGILLDAMNIPGDLIDNRPPKGPAADMLRALDKSIAIDITDDMGLAVSNGRDSYDDLVKRGALCACHTPAVPIGPQHYEFVSGRKLQPLPWDVPAELAVCEDSGNHIPGRHLLGCPDFS